MPLWGFFVLFFAAFAIAMGGALHYFLTMVLVHVVTGQAYSYASAEAMGLVVIVLAILALLLLVLCRSIATPLRRLSRAIQVFSASGTLTPVPTSPLAPREVRALARAFAQMEGKVEKVHQRDQEISRVKSDFISTAAHQLRTPLTGIRWALEALEAANPTEDQKALILSAVEKSKELVAIVGTLLDISAIESGKYKYTFTPIDVPALLGEVSRDFSPLAQKQGVSLVYAGGEAVPAARADRLRIKWVLDNVVENALNYTPAGGSVWLTVEAVGGVVLVHVRDTGIGILPGDRENIFERFFRGENAVNKENEGNGLGLYIARTIATDHGGDLTFKPNSDGPGTTFTLSLPVA